MDTFGVRILLSLRILGQARAAQFAFRQSDRIILKVCNHGVRQRNRNR